MCFTTALAAIHERGGDQEFLELRRNTAISRVQDELSCPGEVVDGDHRVVRALMCANAVPMGEPAGPAEVVAHMFAAWEHYEGKWRASGAPGSVA